MRRRKETDYGVKTHTCICPKCRMEHKQTFFWSGAGRPRKFCHDCQYFVGEYDSRPDHSPAGKPHWVHVY